MNTLPHAGFSGHLRTARWHAFLSMFRSTVNSSDKLTPCFLGSVISDREVIGHRCSTVPWKVSGAPSRVCSGTSTPSSRSSQRRSQRISFARSHEPEKMYDAVVQQIAHRVVPQDLSAHMHHSDVHGESGDDARTATPCR